MVLLLLFGCGQEPDDNDATDRQSPRQSPRQSLNYFLSRHVDCQAQVVCYTTAQGVDCLRRLDVSADVFDVCEVE